MSAEHQGKDGGFDPIKTVALVLAGKIKKEDLNENDRRVLDYYGPGGLMADDYKFRQSVYAMKERIIADETQQPEPKNDDKPMELVNRSIGRRIPLFTPEELKNAKRHKKRKVDNNEPVIRLPLWQDEPQGNKDFFGSENVFDPDRKLYNEIKKIDSRFNSGENTILAEEIKHKRAELRNIIG